MEKEKKNRGSHYANIWTFKYPAFRIPVKHLANDLSEQIRKKNFALLVHFSSSLNVELHYGFQRAPVTSNVYNRSSLIDLNIFTPIRQFLETASFLITLKSKLASLPTFKEFEHASLHSGFLVFIQGKCGLK